MILNLANMLDLDQDDYRISTRRLVVFTNGCFDLLHGGHLDVLRACTEEAKPHGLVVVGVNDDESVRRIKGPNRPIMNAYDRAKLVDSIKGVDYVFIFGEDTPAELIKFVKPDLIVKGGDYRVEDVVGHETCPVKIVPTRAGISTTELIERLKK